MMRLFFGAVLALLLLPTPATAAGAANLRTFEGPPMVREATALVQPVARTLTMLTSSYCLGGTTATGARVGVGIVAADIAQLPFGTRLYVAGYGFAKVEDDGPAIGRGRLDLWLPPAHGCAASFAWGMRRVKVEILGRPYLSHHVPPRLRAADVRYVRERGKAAWTPLRNSTRSSCSWRCSASDSGRRSRSTAPRWRHSRSPRRAEGGGRDAHERQRHGAPLDAVRALVHRRAVDRGDGELGDGGWNRGVRGARGATRGLEMDGKGRRGMSEQKQCPECEALIDGALERCPVCDETLAAPITFERYSGVLNRNDGFRLRWQRNNTPENQHLIGPWNGDATDGDLRAAGYVRLPSAEELAKRIHAMANPNCFPPAIWPEGGCGGCWAEAERALRALEVTA